MISSTGDPQPRLLPRIRPVRRWDQDSRSLFLRPDTGAWVVVEGVGREIIELCDGTRTADSIAEAIARSYGIDAAPVQSDVAEYLAALLKSGFLGSSPATQPPRSTIEGLALHVTSRCNLNCRHCYASPAADAGQDPPIALLVSAAEEARALGALTFKLTGGDPLLRPEALEALAGPMDGADVTVLTNGLASYSELAALVADRGWRLQISLDGADDRVHDSYRGPGAFAELSANLRRLADDGLTGSVTLSVCLSKLNHTCIEDIVGLAMSWGVSHVHLARISKHGRAERFWDELSLSPEEWVRTYTELAAIHRRYSPQVRLTGFLRDYLLSCLGRPTTRGCEPGRHVMVDLDGRVYPCIMMGTPEMCLGDLARRSLRDCLRHEDLAAVGARCQARLEDEAVCGACDWRMICRGACPGWPLVQEGSLSRTDDLCAVRRELLPNLIFEISRDGSSSASPSTGCTV